MKKIAFLGAFVLLFSGCVTLEELKNTQSEIEKNIADTKENFQKKIEEGQQKIEEIKANAEEKKAAFDRKIQELEDAKNALNTLFGSDSSEGEKNSITLKLKELEIQEDVLEAEQNERSEKMQLQLKILEYQKRLDEISIQKEDK